MQITVIEPEERRTDPVKQLSVLISQNMHIQKYIFSLETLLI